MSNIDDYVDRERHSCRNLLLFQEGWKKVFALDTALHVHFVAIQFLKSGLASCLT